jgi:FKBP-type peptidyl-prolyl cis-trans isomerase SlyD
MKAQIVSFHCVLRSRVGNRLISSTFNHDVITAIDADAAPSESMLAGLAERLQNLKKGEKRSISLSAQEAYGFYDPSLVRECARADVSHGERLEIGSEVLARTDSGEKKMFRVVAAKSGSVTLDGNHPLAGMDLIFDIEATEARDATTEELAESGGPSEIVDPQGRTLH